MKLTDIYYFSGTHWDREWYETFQGFRHHLVEMTDELIEHIENNDDYGTYHFDGQTIVLEDYKEIAPENAPRLKKLIEDGRIKVGPWYDMPDECLLSGESLIRNLMFGHKLSKEWGGEPWKFGYVCDIFGHTAQMPQIFNGFDIKYSILGRGTTETDPAFFIWSAPDGSECINFKLDPESGYGSFSSRVQALHLTGEEQRKAIKEFIDSEIERSNAPIVIVMDAVDHQYVQKNTAENLKMLKELYPDANVHHCDLTKIGDQLDGLHDELPIISGELNKTAEFPHSYLHLITNTLSSYYTHKKMNDECQNILEKIVEPMYAYSVMNGKKIRRSYLEKAYEYLLKNHPHDSICGCSISQVHKDMVYRFDQVKEIATVLSEDFLYDDGAEAGNSSNYALKIYNPLPFERNETVKTDIVLKEDFPTKYAEPFQYEEIFSFKLIDNNGNEIPYQINTRTKNYYKRTHRLEGASGECYNISFTANLPAGGYAEYKIVPYERPLRYLPSLTSGSNWVENDAIKMEISCTGDISVFDKKTGMTYDNLCKLVDDGEIGDGWYHSRLLNDRVIYSDSPARIEKIENGPSSCTFRITKEMEIPEQMDNLATGKERSNRYVKMPIVIEASISETSRFIDITMTVDNTAKDHRLRLMIPTQITEDKYFAGQTYYCCERKVGINPDTLNWRETDQYEKHMNGIVGKRRKDGTGIAFVSACGLHECSAFEDGNLYVTLLRAFGTVVQSMPQEGGQLLKKLTYQFRFVPLDADTSYNDLVKLQDCLGTKPICHATETTADFAPENKSFMKIDGDNLSMSIVKPSEDGEENTIVVRVYNASNEKASGNITFAHEISKATSTNMNEEYIADVSSNSNVLPIELDAWKVGTYKIMFK